MYIKAVKLSLRHSIQFIMNILMQILIFFCFYHLSFSRPLPQPPQEDSDGETSEPAAKKTCLNKLCYFSTLRTTQWESHDRPLKSRVNKECSLDTISFADLEKEVEISDKTGETSPLALLLCRGAGVCDLDFTNPEVLKKWKNTQICTQHADELLRKWGDSNSVYHKQHVYRSKKLAKQENVCSIPDGVGKTHNTRSLPNTVLKINQADAILKQLGYLVHPGIPICKVHYDFVQTLMKEHERKPRKRAFIREGSFIEPDVEDTCPLPRSACDPDFAAEGKTNLQTYFKEFVKAANVGSLCPSQRRYSNLKDRTK
ncbi:hypothetical protein B9Z55_025866 [Caenorhabditis nigoni]|uniref:Uncharacterized protein n=1 Tax=Caenorhabditis nigoni TaxID=1611254 RepID=A0A2G5T0I8_9PELO|nr:hypothetical protein B9Z55_025866 [Caenorhabditis nigoni]